MAFTQGMKDKLLHDISLVQFSAGCELQAFSKLHLFQGYLRQLRTKPKAGPGMSYNSPQNIHGDPAYNVSAQK